MLVGWGQSVRVILLPSGCCRLGHTCWFWCPNFCGFGDLQEALSSGVSLCSVGIVAPLGLPLIPAGPWLDGAALAPSTCIHGLSSSLLIHGAGTWPSPRLPIPCWALWLLGQDVLAPLPHTVGHRSVGHVGVFCSALHGPSS